MTQKGREEPCGVQALLRVVYTAMQHLCHRHQLSWGRKGIAEVEGRTAALQQCYATVHVLLNLA